MDSIFKHQIPIQLRFNDIDPLGHVNNSIYFNFFDLGKTGYFETIWKQNIDWQKSDVVIASCHADFLLPIFFHEKVAVETAVTHIGNKSFKMEQRIVNTENNTIKCVCSTVMVSFDIKTGESKPVPGEWKQAIIDFEKNPDLIK